MSDIIVYSWKLTYKILQISCCLIFLYKSTYNKYTINKEDKIIRKKYILSNTKRVI